MQHPAGSPPSQPCPGEAVSAREEHSAREEPQGGSWCAETQPGASWWVGTVKRVVARAKTGGMRQLGRGQAASGIVAAGAKESPSRFAMCTARPTVITMAQVEMAMQATVLVAT